MPQHEHHAHDDDQHDQPYADARDGHLVGELLLAEELDAGCGVEPSSSANLNE